MEFSPLPAPTASMPAGASANANAIAGILSHPRIFRLGDFGRGSVHGEAHSQATGSGFEALDRELAGGGWARPGITEILCDHLGVGELSLLLKGLGEAAQAARPGEAAHLLWIMPHTQAMIPYAPALAQCGIDLDCLAIVRTHSTGEALWTAEQGLKSGACRAVLLRMNEAWVNPLSLLRLNQAATAGGSLLWLTRPREAAPSPSPAATRIVLQPEAAGALTLNLLKRRGLPAGKSIRLVTRSLACLVREPRHVRAPAKTSSLGWLDRVLGSSDATTVESANVRARSFSRERG